MKSKLLLLLLIITLLLSACAPKPESPTNTPPASTPPTSTSEEKVHLIMGHGAAEGSIGDLYCIKFKEIVEEKSGGRITADVYAGSQLGTYGEMLQGLKTGDVSIMIFQPAPAVSFIPELAMLDLPYAFMGKTKEQIDITLNHSEYTKLLDESFEKAGYKRMSFVQAASFREVTSSKELRSIDDFKGLKIRTLENKYHIEFWKSVGASPTPLAFGELYLSLQQGLVDAQENPYDTSLAAKFPEVQDYVVNTHHIIYPNMFLVNDALYKSLPDDLRAIFDESAEEAKAYAEGLMADSNTTNLRKLEEAGMEVIDFSDEELAKFKEKAASVEALLKEDLGEEVVDTFMKSLGN